MDFKNGDETCRIDYMGLVINHHGCQSDRVSQACPFQVKHMQTCCTSGQVCISQQDLRGRPTSITREDVRTRQQ